MNDSGTLYIVATPIGNLSDITERAKQVLADVDLIAAEDTRHSQKLLSAYGIQSRLVALHDHNEQHQSEVILNWLQEGKNIALVSDAGTPLISDPGYKLVRTVRHAGIDVVPVPGACAAITALCASGIATDRFSFEGFLPSKRGARSTALEALRHEPRTMVFYESPRRIVETLQVVIDQLGDDREVVLAKELSKRFETFVQGAAPEVLAWLQQDEVHCKGEFVLVIAGYKAPTEETVPAEADRMLQRLVKELPLKTASAVVADLTGVRKKLLYQHGLSFSDK